MLMTTEQLSTTYQNVKSNKRLASCASGEFIKLEVWRHRCVVSQLGYVYLNGKNSSNLGYIRKKIPDMVREPNLLR